MKTFKINLFTWALMFSFFHIIFLGIEDRLVYVPAHISSKEWGKKFPQEWENFINFLKSFWRTSLAVGSRIIFFWVWTFLKVGFLVFILELMGIWGKEKIILNGVIYSLFPILFLIFFKFLFLIFLKKEFISSLSLFLNSHNSFLNFLFSSFEFFKCLEYSFLYSYLRKHLKIKKISLIFILSPLFFLEKIIEFTYIIK